MERIYGKEEDGSDDIIQVGDYTLSEKQRTVYLGEDEIQLTNKEYELFCYLVKNKNIVVSRGQILNNVWGEDYFGSDRVVDDTIRRLRKKVDKLNIETVYGYGYKLVCKS